METASRKVNSEHPFMIVARLLAKVTHGSGPEMHHMVFQCSCCARWHYAEVDPRRNGVSDTELPFFYFNEADAVADGMIALSIRCADPDYLVEFEPVRKHENG
jgi:hypothetical protein